MYDIKFTDEFNLWLRRLKDHSTRIRLARCLEKASCGLLGDVKPIGDGLYEMRALWTKLENVLRPTRDDFDHNVGWWQ